MKAVYFIALLVISAQASKLDALSDFISGIEDETGLDLGAIIDCFDESSAKIAFKTFTKNLKQFKEQTMVRGDVTSQEDTKTMMDVSKCIKESEEDIKIQLLDFAQDNDIKQDNLKEMNKNPVILLEIAGTILKDFKNKEYFEAGQYAAKTFLKKAQEF